MDHTEYCRKYVLFDGFELKKVKEALVGKIEFLERDGTEEKYIVKKDSIEPGMPSEDVVCTVTNEAQTVLESNCAMDQLLDRMAKKIDALMSGLKPCPFCGGRAELDPSFLGSDWGVSCVECRGGFSFSTYGGINHDRAKEAWNRRYILEEKVFDSAMRRERKKHWIDEYKANDPRFGYNETKLEKKLAVRFVCGLPPKKCENMGSGGSSNVEDAE